MSILPRFTQSFASLDLCFRCCVSLPRLVTDCFLDRFGPRGLCRGGRVDDRPGGEVAMIEESKSLGRLELSPEKGSLVMAVLLGCKGGSSTEDLGILSFSESDTHSCIGRSLK